MEIFADSNLMWTSLVKYSCIFQGPDGQKGERGQRGKKGPKVSVL